MTLPRQPLSRFAKGLLVLEILLSAGALGGGFVLIMAPRGEIMPLPLSALAGSPFDTYLGPGLILFSVLGLGPLVAARLAWLRHPVAALSAFIVGVALLIWVAVEIAIIGYSNEPPLQAIYLTLGVAITLGAIGWVRDVGLGRDAREDRGSDLIRNRYARYAQEAGRRHSVNTRSITNRLAAIATTLATFAAGAGLLIPGLYRDAPYWSQQARGTDLATLLVAVPILAFGLWAARRGSAAGQLAVFAGLLYVVYNYGIFVFSVVMNPLTAVHIAIVGLALWSLVLMTRSASLTEAGIAVTAGLSRRVSGVLLIAVAALFSLLWIGQIATATTTGVLAPDLVKAGLSTNPVYALDLAFFLPLCAVAGIGLLRRNAAAAYGQPMLIWVALMGAGVVGGFLFTAAAGEEVPVMVAAVISALSLVSAAFAAVPLVRHASGPLTVGAPRPAHQGR